MRANWAKLDDTRARLLSCIELLSQPTRWNQTDAAWACFQNNTSLQMNKILQTASARFAHLSPAVETFTSISSLENLCLRCKKFSIPARSKAVNFLFSVSSSTWSENKKWISFLQRHRLTQVRCNRIFGRDVDTIPLQDFSSRATETDREFQCARKVSSVSSIRNSEINKRTQYSPLETGYNETLLQDFKAKFSCPHPYWRAPYKTHSSDAPQQPSAQGQTARFDTLMYKTHPRFSFQKHCIALIQSHLHSLQIILSLSSASQFGFLIFLWILCFQKNLHNILFPDLERWGPPQGHTVGSQMIIVTIPVSSIHYLSHFRMNSMLLKLSWHPISLFGRARSTRVRDAKGSEIIILHTSLDPCQYLPALDCIFQEF